MRTTIFTIDRAAIPVRAALAETIANHLSEGEIKPTSPLNGLALLEQLDKPADRVT